MTQQSGAVWLTDPQGYQANLQQLLGDRDPIEVLAETPDVLAGIIGGQTDERMRARPFPGKWTPNEILGHLCDAEWAFGWRLRLILGHDGAPITGYDQEVWVTTQRYNNREPQDLLETFRGLRSFNLPTWKLAVPDALDRVGQHNERGPETLGLMLRMNAGHDLTHIDQLKRYLAAG